MCAFIGTSWQEINIHFTEQQKEWDFNINISPKDINNTIKITTKNHFFSLNNFTLNIIRSLWHNVNNFLTA